MTEGEKAKVDVEEGQNEETLQEVKEPTPEPQEDESVEQPESKEGKGEKAPGSIEQQLKTLQGMYNKTQEELNALKQEKADFQGVVTTIQELQSTINQQGETLNLMTDILNETAVDNTELQEKINQAKQKAEENKKQAEVVQQIGQEMGERVQYAQQLTGLELNILPQDETLKPAWQAAAKGDRSEALRLITVAIDAKVSALRTAKPDETLNPEGSKEDAKKGAKKIPVLTSTPGVNQDWRDKTPKQKIMDGLQEKQEE